MGCGADGCADGGWVSGGAGERHGGADDCEGFLGSLLQTRTSSEVEFQAGSLGQTRQYDVSGCQ